MDNQGKSMGATVQEALKLAEEQYARYEEIVRLARLAAETQRHAQLARSVSYPMGFVMDKKAVNGFLG